MPRLGEIRSDEDLSIGSPGGEAFPVGSVFITIVSTNPSTLLGYGTWQTFAAGRMLVGLDGNDTSFDTVEETGGAKTHTLSESEMPSHTHIQDSHNHVQNAHNHTQNAHTHTQNPHNHVQGVNSASTGGLSGYGIDTSTNNRVNSGYVTSDTIAVNQAAIATNNPTTATNQEVIAVNQNAGGGQPHNNMPPYIVVYMWKRIL